MSSADVTKYSLKVAITIISFLFVIGLTYKPPQNNGKIQKALEKAAKKPKRGMDYDQGCQDLRTLILKRFLNGLTKNLSSDS